MITRSEASEPTRPDILDLNIMRGLIPQGLKLIEASQQAKQMDLTVCNNVIECMQETRTNSCLPKRVDLESRES